MLNFSVSKWARLNLHFKSSKLGLRLYHNLKTMIEPKRYFINTLEDIVPNEELKQSMKWKAHIYEMMTDIVASQPPSHGDCDGGLYVGCSGVGYMFYHVIKTHVLDMKRDELLNRALEYMNVALEYANTHKRDSKTNASFLLGNPGVYAVAAALYNLAGMRDSVETCIAEYVACAPRLKRDKPNSDELFVGRAGYLAGALWLEKTLSRRVVPPEVVNELCGLIVESGRNYSKQNRSLCPLMFAYHGTEYLGAAHGLSSILQMLISCPGFLQSDRSALNDVRASVDFLLGLQTDSGNFPTAMDEVGRQGRKDELVHWCHGAPGVVYLMAKAYLVWGDKKYFDACVKCGDLVWAKGLLKKGPGICHGLAGSGYVLLLLHRLTQDPRYLDRAFLLASFLYSPDFKRARTPDCPYSLYEGLSGTVCFLSDLLTPETAAFPFQDVF